ncbi:hypothetical protein NEOLEDRAFT_1136655 [Neolentinus lepideus HHB14362 ss-1]|uniref:F-box domain-containing protein n=1 Tax=Neolentinus lepideus HHB14362 ss-1 TaxID=1314782 RepID=A0A165R524_9AGAM|nr:hypothetical protein NEOLEDRAFT_1136655 [Neolentinus lepideus HHB14362 ss-1]
MALQQKQMNFPPDMIGEIASYMGQEAREASKSHSKVSPYGWNVLGLVSKTWRNAVFYSATLWKEVVITSVEALRNVMIRSGRCTVTADEGVQEADETAEY